VASAVKFITITAIIRYSAETLNKLILLLLICSLFCTGRKVDDNRTLPFSPALPEPPFDDFIK
ncbi:MAG: hypothetical protein E7I27_25995, partial [Klebsiella michiganensis]|nr:hypothetical protein [Klebsiella michiganensis]